MMTTEQLRPGVVFRVGEATYQITQRHPDVTDEMGRPRAVVSLLQRSGLSKGQRFHQFDVPLPASSWEYVSDAGDDPNGV